MKLCVVTVVSADSFQYYIPLFIYTWKRAYPDVRVKVFLLGELNPEVEKSLQLIRESGIRGFSVYTGAFSDILPAAYHKSVPNVMRFLVPHKYLRRYDYAYITDVDFLAFKHVPSHFRYNIRLLDGPIAAHRSPKRKPRRPEVYGKDGWRGIYARLAAGTVLIKVEEWYKRTKKIRAYYTRLLKTGAKDPVDKQHVGEYREYDEVMLQRMCHHIGIGISEKRYHYKVGGKFNVLYRDVHLGDSKFRRHASKKKMAKRIHKKNVKAFLSLEKDPVWQVIARRSGAVARIREALRRMRKYTESI